MKFLEMLQTRFGRIKIEAEDIIYHPIISDKDAYDCSTKSDGLIRQINDVYKEVVDDMGNWSRDQPGCMTLYRLKLETCKLKDRLTQHVSRVNSERGIHGSAPRPSVARPKAYSGGTSVMEYIEWRQASRRYHEASRFSDQQAVESYKVDLTRGLAAEAISRLRTKEHIIQALDYRYGSKQRLVVECKDALASISPPDPRKAAAAADYVTTALTKIQAIMHIMQEEGVVDQLLAYGLEEPILRTMDEHPRLQVYVAKFGQLFGEETNRSGMVDSRKLYDLLVTCLTQAESDLLYVRATQK